jgi:hypothetical protein
MCDLEPPVVSRDRRAPRGRVNAFGDIVCPACGAQLLTPRGCYVRSGPARCSLCSTWFRVATATARAANRRAEALAARISMEVLLHDDPA